MPKRDNSEIASSSLSLDPLDKDLVCGACLLELFSDDCEFIGAPADCPHLFHWDCLINWGEVQNTCPQCKNRFRLAARYRASDRGLIECVKFKKRDRLRQDVENDTLSDLPVELCEKCKEPGNDDDMILCDGMDYTCNAIFHYRCVGYHSLPDGLWFCDTCVEKGFVPEELQSEKPKRSKAKFQHIDAEIQPRHKASASPDPIRKPGVVLSMPPPNLFSIKLIIPEGATRRTHQSSGLPSNLLVSPPPTYVPIQRTEVPQSVFARFREKRALKRQANS